MAAAVWTLAAEIDLAEIALFIGRERASPAAAQRVVRAVFGKVDQYASEPLLGTARPELGADVRSFVVFRYVVFYRPSAQGIEVLRVIHGARDVASSFPERDS